MLGLRGDTHDARGRDQVWLIFGSAAARNNTKKQDSAICINRDHDWLDWRIFESPFVERYLLFKYKSSFLIIDKFFSGNIKKLSIIFSSF